MNLSEGRDIFGSDTAASSPCDHANAVVAVHREIDRRTRAFQEQTRLRCPDGCGRCCLSPQVETTVTDLLPLASEIVRRGLAGAILERLEDPTADPRCVLYESEPNDPGRGRCSMYEWRPSICRLFGFAGRRDADGAAQFVSCRVHARVMPEMVAAATELVRRAEISLPIFADLAGQVAAIEPGPAGRPQPINAALREAIHRVALASRLAGGDDDQHGTSPSTPRCPRRAA